MGNSVDEFVSAIVETLEIMDKRQSELTKDQREELRRATLWLHPDEKPLELASLDQPEQSH